MKKFVITFAVISFFLYSAAVKASSQESTVRDAIKRAALDYMDGAHAGDVARMEPAVHPELNKVTPVKLPQTGKTILNKMGTTLVIEGTRAKMGLLPEEKRKIAVTVLDIREEIAMVKVLSAMYCDYIQMAKVDGQ